jgi:hypothetical protein
MHAEFLSEEFQGENLLWDLHIGGVTLTWDLHGFHSGD